MREPNSRIAGEAARPVFTPQQLVAQLMTVLDNYEAHPVGHRKRSLLRARLGKYSRLYRHIALGPITQSLVNRLDQQRFSQDATTTHRYFRRARQQASAQTVELNAPAEVSFEDMVCAQIFEPWINLPMDYGLSVRDFLLEPLRSGVEVQSLELVNQIISEDVAVQLTATAEPITRTICVRTLMLSDPKQQRDLLSVLVDLVMQKQYLTEFYNTEGAMDRQAIQAAMYLVGLNLAVAAYQMILNQCPMIKPEIFSDAMVIKVDAEHYHSACYLRYVVEHLIIDPIDYIVSTAACERVGEIRDEVISKYPSFYALRRCRILLHGPSDQTQLRNEQVLGEK